jgi:hypothetical protein
VWVRFSHHAKNQLRLYGGTGEEVETVVRRQSGKGFDRRGNPLYRGMVDGRLTIVVVAADRSELRDHRLPEGAEMKADYDSEADAILIEIEEVDHWDNGVSIDDAMYCQVAFRDRRPVGVTLRYPREEMHLLGRAAERFGLDAVGLLATTQAALAAPDHEVRVEVDPRVLAWQ